MLIPPTQFLLKPLYMPWFPIWHYRKDNGEALPPLPPPPDSSDEDNLMKIDGQPSSAEVAIVDPNANDEVEIV